MQSKRTAALLTILILVALSTAPLAYSQSEQSNTIPQDESSRAELLSSILGHMEEARLTNKQQFRPYTVTREYKLFDNEEKAREAADPNSEVIATVEFVPPNRKTFQIERVEGSDRGKSIVKHILENESEMAAKGAPQPLTRQHYDFKLVGESILDGQPCWMLQLTPHHDDKSSIKGNAWIDKNTYLTHQVQGEMAKSPSWWIKKVQMTMRYGNAAGMWLPTSSYAVADVRIFGKHVLTSQALKVETSEQTATTFPATAPHLGNRRSARNAPLVGASVYAPR